MDKAIDRKIYVALQAAVVVVGLVFAALFIRDIWLHHQFNLQKILGYILFFGAADLLVFQGERNNLKDIIVPLILLVLASILIVV